eukprot:TRINITY_DN22930_c0_g1_i1.p1 TRINITY_DN22930_c0_g1~~TRINITY_DN22930_c0_g1_i1.p1  ORF type:complete len:566 (-),score=98.83 TRINITY_DN22930_c0_g1_i1:158-1855(-)
MQATSGNTYVRAVKLTAAKPCSDGDECAKVSCSIRSSSAKSSLQGKNLVSSTSAALKRKPHDLLSAGRGLSTSMKKPASQGLMYKRNSAARASYSDEFAGTGDGKEEQDLENAKTLPPLTGALYPAVGIACLAAFLFGYHISVVNGSLEYIAKDLGFPGNANIAGWVVSILLAGATFGSFAGGTLADRFGRTRAFQINALPLILGTILSATARGVSGMMVGRFLAGIGIGVSSALVPLYISEVAPTEIRGALGSVNQLTICIGILAALTAGLPLASYPGWWRIMFWLSIIPALLLLCGMSYMPDSPRWLFKEGRVHEAEAAVTTLWGKPRTALAMQELEAGKADSGGTEEGGWSDLFSKRYRAVVTIGGALFFFQQFAGINAVIYYSTAVFRKVGVTSDTMASALVGVANVAGTAAASYLMDRQGRRKLLLGSYLGMAASMFLLSLSLSWPALGAYARVLAIVGTITYILAFSLGVGPVPGLLLSEIFGSRIRAKAMSFSLTVHWVCNFCIGLTFLRAVDVVGVKGVYLLFGSVCILAYFYVKRYIVETKGKSLEDIERIFSPAV